MSLLLRIAKRLRPTQFVTVIQSVNGEYELTPQRTFDEALWGGQLELNRISFHIRREPDDTIVYEEYP